MIYANRKKKKVLNIVATCGCACGCGNGIEIRTISGNVYITALNSDWYKNQTTIRTLLGDRIQDAIKCIKHEDIYIKDIIMNKDDVKVFLNYCEQLYFENNEEDEAINTSRLMIEPLYCGAKYPMEYSLVIKANDTIKPVDYLLGKKYKTCDICLTKTEWLKLVKIMKKYFEYCENRYEELRSKEE